MEQQIVTIYPEEVVFKFDPTKFSQGSFQITNVTGQLITYKVRTTNPKMYQVKPSLGYLQSGNALTIEVQTTSPFAENIELKDKFQILTALISDGDDSGDLQAFWKKLDPKQINTIALKTKLQAYTNLGAPMESIKEEEHHLEQSANLDPIFQSISQPMFKKIQEAQPQVYNSPVHGSAQVQAQPQEESLLSFYQTENQRLSKEISDLKIIIQNVQNQKQIQHQGTTQAGGQFSLKQLLIVLVVALILGSLVGNR